MFNEQNKTILVYSKKKQKNNEMNEIIKLNEIWKMKNVQKTQNTCINERKETKNKWNEKEITKLQKMWTMKKCTKNTK